CQPAPTRSLATTWLVTSPTYGVAWVVADCRATGADLRPVQALFLVRRDRQDGPVCDHWTANNAGFLMRAPNGPVPVALQARVPEWFPLPPGSYLSNVGGPSLYPHSSVRSWTSASHAFIAGRFEGQATRPAGGAQAVTVAGQAGLLVQGQGLVTV